MAFEVGDPVMATVKLGGMLVASVPKGTRGVITRISVFGGSITVDFENGRTETVRPESIAKANRPSGWW